jgi:hypothetical protein
MIGRDASAPYVIGRETFPSAAFIGFDAIGGASLDACDDAMRTDVRSKLKAADHISVRDTQTQSHLRAAGIDAPLAPDPVSMIETLFSARIHAHAQQTAMQRVKHAHPNGYLAVQFSADFGDDATLAQLASQLRALDRDIVLFRAGAAPWHDDLDVYARLVTHLKDRAVTVFGSLDVWDICALIAASAGFIGSSLHGRIVAMAYARPRVNLLHPGDAARTGKQAAYAATWDTANMPGAVGVGQLCEAWTGREGEPSPRHRTSTRKAIERAVDAN